MLVLLLGSFLMVPLAVGVIFVPLALAVRSQSRDRERTVAAEPSPPDALMQRKAARELARIAFADQLDRELVQVG
jgi:cell division septation protein DedD